MNPDVVLIMLLAMMATAIPSFIVWLRASRRIRDLEMTLLTRTTDEAREEDLRQLLEQLLIRTEQLSDQQALLVARLGERAELRLPAPKPEQSRPVTPH
ncbi:MAG: hypothetical protein U0133_17310 [Gemmatimonadales bacterium]